MHRQKPVIRDVDPLCQRACISFRPPDCGTEFSGPESGFAAVRRAWTILTPVKGATRRRWRSLKRFWLALGSQVDVMEPGHHDLVLAITSHTAASDRLQISWARPHDWKRSPKAK